MKKMCESVQRFITHVEDHWKEEEKKLYYKRDLCPTPTKAELVVECLCDVFLGEDWYVTFPLHSTQVNTCILDEILYKYYRPYRKYIDKRNKELMKGKKNNVDEYYDMYNEPSELDIIVNEALDKIQENVKEVMKLKLEKLAKLDEDISEKSKELVNLKYKLSTAQKNLSEVEKKAEELEDKMPARYVNRFIHNAIGNFAPGDKVWVVKTKYDSVKCDMCDGIGKVRIVNSNNNVITCPSCSGRGTTSKWYYTVEEDKVKDIYLTLCFDKEHRACYWNKENIYLESNTEYSTNVDRIFETEPEAQKECDRLNKEKENKYA